MGADIADGRIDLAASVANYGDTHPGALHAVLWGHDDILVFPTAFMSLGPSSLARVPPGIWPPLTFDGSQRWTVIEHDADGSPPS